MQSRLGVPVLEGVTPAVKIAELLVKLNYKTCKYLSYSFPEDKRIMGYDNAFLKFRTSKEEL
jgi:allantoin racemase